MRDAPGFGRPRWRKLARDVWTARGRVLLMVTAIAVSLVAIGAVLGAFAVLTREIARNYLGTRPASATLELPGGVSPEIVAQVRQHGLAAEAEAREVVVARARVGDEWRRTLLFAIDDFRSLRLNTFRSESGAWPPPEGAALMERSSRAMLGVQPGQRLLVKPPHGAARELEVAGLVHDPGLAPAWQERSGYLYVTRQTLALLGEPPLLTELRVELPGGLRGTESIEARAQQLGRWLAQRGHTVRNIRVPPPAQHPHQRQMTTVLLMMLGFGVMALVLSAVLVATSLAAMLARQVREVGVMKTLGARSVQIAGLYLVLVGGIGFTAVLLAIPLGVLGTSAFASAISSMLNFTLVDAAIPSWVFAVQAAAGIVIPVLVGAVPIARASRATVRQALDDHGVGSGGRRVPGVRWPRPVRDALRRPGRLALTLGLLATGGAMFITAVNVKRGWQANVDKLYETRSYDVELQLQAPAASSLAQELARLPGVRQVEGWGYTPAAFARPGEIDVVRTYPDRGHGSLLVMAPPSGTGLVSFPLRAGRWLRPEDDDAVVLNHAALAQSPGLVIGDRVLLSLDGAASAWRLTGVVEEIGSPAVAYVSQGAFGRVTDTYGRARLFRIRTGAASGPERNAVIRAIDEQLVRSRVAVESVVPLAELRTAIGDHILILVRSLMAMAAILAVVGALGLGSTMGITVVERTRELAIMKTLGATPARIVGTLIAEGLAIGVASWFLALGLSVPLSLFVDRLIGNLGFLAPLPLVMSAAAAAGWALLTLVVGTLATLIPARSASRLVIREALIRS